jgi:hypothetical protein
MVAPRLVRLIETHSEQLASGLMRRLLNDERVGDLRKVPPEELRHRAWEIYRNLSDWLLTKTETEVERRYLELGARRAAQGVALSHVLFALQATKEHLWEYLKSETMADRPVELFQELDLFQMVDQFFDRASFHAARGYEAAVRQKAA